MGFDCISSWSLPIFYREIVMHDGASRSALIFVDLPDNTFLTYEIEFVLV